MNEHTIWDAFSFNELNTESLWLISLNIYRIRHRIALPNGHWHAIVKAKNSEGWSTFSNTEDLIVEGKLNEINIKNDSFTTEELQNTNFVSFLFSGQTSGSSTLMTVPMSYIISIATLLSIYSINFAARRFAWENYRFLSSLSSSSALSSSSYPWSSPSFGRQWWNNNNTFYVYNKNLDGKIEVYFYYCL